MSSYLEQSIKNLNKEQRLAVETIEGPVMVVAGPGTGKTQILALRIANILNKTDATPSNILCLTFTEAGVKAMRERLQRFIGNDAYYVSIHTFHSFANEVIQTFPEEFNFNKEMQQLDDLKRLKVIQSIVDQISEERLNDDKYKKSKIIPFYNKYARQFDITSAIQTLKKEAIDVEKFKEKIDELKNYHEENVTERAGKPTKKWQDKMDKIESLYEVLEIYKRYQKQLSEEGLYDYEDMIMYVIDQFKNNETLLANYQERYLYILVDEYQDTNGSQNEIIKLLGNFDKSPNIFVVGDDDQAIYRFQGASLENILFFTSNFDGVRVIPIPINYRSTQTILDIASSVIKNNFNRLSVKNEDITKVLKSDSGEKGNKANLLEFNNADEENIYLAKEIKRLHEEENVNYSDIAILYRKNAHAIDINEVLNKFEVPTKLDATKNIFEVESVKKIINILKLISAKKFEDQLLYEVMMYEFFNIEVVEVYKLTRKAYEERSSLETLIFDGDQSEAINKFKEQILNWKALSSNIPINRFIEIIINESRITDTLLEKEKSKEDEIFLSPFEEVLAINSFFNYVNNQYQSNRELTVTELLKDLDVINDNKLSVNLQKINTGEDAVNLMTAHSAKGLEFEHVFIVKATDNNWGGRNRNTSLLLKEVYTDVDYDDDEKNMTLEDERRLFFVAITRAKKNLTFTYANEYESNGNISKASPSQFLNEIDPEYVNKVESLDFNIDDYVSKLKPLKIVAYSSTEEAFLKEQVDKFKLTPTSLNVYLDSPEEFKNQFLIRVPRIQTKEAALGTALHFVMEQVNRTLSIENMVLSLEECMTNLEKSLKKEFYGNEEYEITLLEGKRILEEYYKNVLSVGQTNGVIEFEYNFFSHNVCLDPKDGTDPIKLSGRIDKIEWLDKDSNSVRVVDYKNKTPISSNQIKGLTAVSKPNIWRQLVFYKLLGDLDSNFRPNRSQNSSKYRIDEVEVHFLKPNQSKKYKTEVFRINEGDVEELKQVIIDTMKKIRDLEFSDNK